MTLDSEAGVDTLRLAVGSIRGPKLEAVRLAAGRLLPTLPSGRAAFRGFEVWSAGVDSGVAETPLDLDALVEGAAQRARRALRLAGEQGFVPHFSIGLEGGACRGPGGHLYLQSWACVSDGRRESFGGGPALLLPPVLVQKLVAGASLASAIDEVTGSHDVRSRGGTFGVLTRDRLDRAAIFEAALVCAFAPFDLPELYAQFHGGDREDQPTPILYEPYAC